MHNYEQDINKQLIDNSEQNKNQNSSKIKKKINLSMIEYNTSGNLNKNSVLSSNKFKNSDKNMIKPNLFKSVIAKKGSTTDSMNNFRMTALRSTNTKTYLNKSTLYDTILKESHPENLKKKLKSKFKNISEYVNKENIEVIKEKDDKKSEKDDEKTEKKELNLSIDFDDIDTEKEESLEIIDDEGDSGLFEKYKDDDKEEMAELKKIWYGDDLKKSIQYIQKSILKKATVKFKDNVDKKEKENNIKKNFEIKKIGNNSTESTNKREEKSGKLNKNLKMIKEEEKDSNNNLENIKLESQFQKGFKNDLNRKNNIQKNIHFDNDEDYSKKVEVNKSIGNNNINNLSEKSFLTKNKEALPNENNKIIEDNNKNDKNNDLFISNLNNKKILKKKKEVHFQDLSDNIPDKKDESTQTNFYDNNRMIRNNINSNNNIIINKNEYNNNFDSSDLDDYFITENEPLNQDKIIKSLLRQKIKENQNYKNKIQHYKNKIALLKFAFYSLLLVILIYFM